MAYATIDDVQARITRTLTDDEERVCATLLDDAAVMIDSAAPNAPDEAKKVVSCRMVCRSLSDADGTVPIGTSSGSMSGLGYSQSWSLGSNGSTGELYLSKAERQMLGISNKIGSHSPVEELVG